MLKRRRCIIESMRRLDRCSLGANDVRRRQKKNEDLERIKGRKRNMIISNEGRAEGAPVQHFRIIATYCLCLAASASSTAGRRPTSSASPRSLWN